MDNAETLETKIEKEKYYELINRLHKDLTANGPESYQKTREYIIEEYGYKLFGQIMKQAIEIM